MKTVVHWLQTLHLLQAFTVFLLVIFLLLVQIGNPPAIAAQQFNIPRYDPTQDYPSPTYKEGINSFGDLDPKAEKAEKSARKRADELIRTSQDNLERKSINSPEKYVRNYQQGTPLDQRIKRLGEDVGRSAKQLQEGVTKGTQQGVENLKENLQKTLR